MNEKMTMLKTLKGWVFICALAFCCPGTHAQTKPNIVLIVADDLGYGDVACYGSSIQTPNIDRLAAEGTRFRDFHSNGSVCSPTRCALMTGRYQQRAGIAGLVRGENGMSPDEFTMAEAMKLSGYGTGMFGKWHLGELPKFNPIADITPVARPAASTAQAVLGSRQGLGNAGRAVETAA